jgi:hypothetical protein
MAKNVMEELFGYRVKVERDGKEVVNIPGIFALPGALIAPKASIIGAIAASLLGCSIHLENADGKKINVGEQVRKAADKVVETASTAAKTVKEEVDKAWDAVSADYPEECAPGEENKPDEADSEDAPAQDTVDEIVDELEKHEADDDIPVIHVEKPNKPE